MALIPGTHTDHALLMADGAFTIFEAAELKTELLAALQVDNDPLEIDLSDVQEVDSSGMQLLVMLKQEAARRNKRLIYSHHSPALISVIELLQLGSYLGDPLLIPNPN